MISLYIVLWFISLLLLHSTTTAVRTILYVILYDTRFWVAEFIYFFYFVGVSSCISSHLLCNVMRESSSWSLLVLYIYKNYYIVLIGQLVSYENIYNTAKLDTRPSREKHLRNLIHNIIIDIYLAVWFFGYCDHSVTYLSIGYYSCV